ncbi:MAG TPA: tail fiber domain-containing protein, partial [Flavobacteriales bacterium]|nr:tail fiber domain-containing protein [Flavobacteriales bacterium]
MKRQFFAAASLLLMLNATAQVTPWVLPGNATTDPLNDFVGTTDNFELVFRTDDLFRFRLNKTETYGTLGGFTSVPANGFGLLTPSSSFIGNGPGPFSLLHLADGAGGNAQPLGYRPWMRVGLTVTGNEDQGYLGHKYSYEDPEDHESGELEDFTDMVFQWSDNPGKYLKDRMRFIFTSAYNASSTGAGSLEGLEAIRLWPKDNDEVNIGLGDFYAGNIADPSNVLEPTERLDVLTGKVRIRELPTDAVSTSTEYVTVNTTTGVLEHRPLPPASIANCEWSRNTTNEHVLSGVGNPGSGGTCPDREWLYTIGAGGSLNAKLSLYQNSNERNVQSGLNVSMVTNPNSVSESYGIRCDVQPAAGQSSIATHGTWSRVTDPKGAYGTGVTGFATKSNTEAVTEMSGVFGTARVGATGSATTVQGTLGESITQGLVQYTIGASGRANVASQESGLLESIGVRGSSMVNGSTVARTYGGRFTTGIAYGGTVGDAYGVRALSNNSQGTLTNSYGLYGEASGGTNNYAVFGYMPDTSGSKWAGYFQGKVTITRNLYHGVSQIFSDGALKTNVEEITDAPGRLEQLQPRSYTYSGEAQAMMGLPAGNQLGFIAQEVEEILPELVSSTRMAAVVDTAGQEVWPGQELKAVNYVGIIPLLVAGYQEQQRTINAMQQQLDQMQQTLAACCANPDGRRMQAPINTTEPTLNDRGDDRKLRIVPNPFNESTTVYYTLERAGRTQLMANSADGRELRVLQ